MNKTNRNDDYKLSAQDLKFATKFLMICSVLMIFMHSIYPTYEIFSCKNEVCELKTVYTLRSIKIQVKQRPSFVEIRKGGRHNKSYFIDSIFEQPISSYRSAEKIKELIESQKGNLNIINRNNLYVYIIIAIIFGGGALFLAYAKREENLLTNYCLPELVFTTWILHIMLTLFLLYKNM